MKSFQIPLLSTAMMLYFAIAINAQEINQAIEFRNKGAEAMKVSNWATAITEFNQALTLINQLGEEAGEEGADMSQEIKDIIPSLHYFLGQELAKASKTDEAIVELKKAIETAELYNDFGTTAADSKKLIDQIHLTTATSLLNDKKYEEAIAAFTTVLEADPANGTIYLYIGMANQSLGKEAQAISSYEKAIELGDNNAPSRLANIYLSQAQTAQRSNPPKWATVYDLAKKALSITESTNANMLFGIAAVQTKKYQEAIPALEKALSAAPSDAVKGQMIYQLALSFEGLGKNNDACGYYKQLVNNATYKEIAEHKIKNVLKCP